MQIEYDCAAGNQALPPVHGCFTLHWGRITRAGRYLGRDEFMMGTVLFVAGYL
jgi:hypothetical protein